MLGNEESILTLVSSKPITDGAFGEQLSEQLIRDGIAKSQFISPQIGKSNCFPLDLISYDLFLSFTIHIWFNTLGY